MTSRCADMVAAERFPCFSAFMRVRDLPTTVRGPVDFSHGLRACMRKDAAARRAGVQPDDVAGLLGVGAFLFMAYYRIKFLE